MSLANCPSCGKLFARHFREICNDCYNAVEKEYETCVEFLRKNKGATIQHVSEETGVSIKQITRFIREGRISLYNLPNLGYPCEICGIPIRESNMCMNCRSRLHTEVRKATSDSHGDAESQNNRINRAYQIGDRLRERD